MNLNTPIYYDSNGNIDWLDDLIAYIIEQEGADLLSIICLFLDQNTCQIKNRDFIDFLKLVSRGELILPCEGFALELDKDLDEGKVFEGAVFDTENIYNIPSNVMPIEKFMNLLEY
ncbi:hypothetical protein VQ643_16080, partial [Pseudomonas sp. F1_0610]|uniref:hypothetical protein n=1 Tax=Pseudomonas sp. F1_0610 TaxID=3114284 RepID=UPI0039C1DF82